MQAAAAASTCAEAPAAQPPTDFASPAQHQWSEKANNTSHYCKASLKMGTT